MEDNGDHQLFGYPYFSKYIILCSTEERNLGLLWNNLRVSKIFLRWTIPLRLLRFLPTSRALNVWFWTQHWFNYERLSFYFVIKTELQRNNIFFWAPLLVMVIWRYSERTITNRCWIFFCANTHIARRSQRKHFSHVLGFLGFFFSRTPSPFMVFCEDFLTDFSFNLILRSIKKKRRC